MNRKEIEKEQEDLFDEREKVKKRLDKINDRIWAIDVLLEDMDETVMEEEEDE